MSWLFYLMDIKIQKWLKKTYLSVNAKLDAFQDWYSVDIPKPNERQEQKWNCSPGALISIPVNLLVTWHHTAFLEKKEGVWFVELRVLPCLCSRRTTCAFAHHSLTTHQGYRCKPGLKQARIYGSPTFSSHLPLWLWTFQVKHLHWTPVLGMQV